MSDVYRSFRFASLWAGRNPGTARNLIIGTKVILVCIAIAAGIMIEAKLPWQFNLAAVILFLTAVLLYPKRHQAQGLFRYNYTRRKVADLVLCICSFCLVMSWSNHEAVVITQEIPRMEQAEAYEVIPVVYHDAPKKQKKAKRSLKRAQRKAFKKQFFAAVKQFKRNLSPGAKTALSILAAAVLFFGFMGIAAWSCNLSCSGNDGAATIVFIGGLVLLVFLGVLMFRGIFGRKYPKRDRSLKGSDLQ